MDAFGCYLTSINIENESYDCEDLSIAAGFIPIVDDVGDIFVLNDESIKNKTTTEGTWGASFKRKYNTGDPIDTILEDGSEVKIQWVYGYLIDGAPTSIDLNDLPNGENEFTLISVNGL